MSNDYEDMVRYRNQVYALRGHLKDMIAKWRDVADANRQMHDWGGNTAFHVYTAAADELEALLTRPSTEDGQ